MMRAIDIRGYIKPKTVSAGTPPALRWLAISDLVTDTSYRRSVVGRGRQHVERIAAGFSWFSFGTVVVTPAGDKFVIIDGQHRATAAALAGFDQVPCVVVEVSLEEQADAFRTINGGAAATSRMALHAAGVVASDPGSVRLTEVCARGEVELLRYPVPVDRQSAGQTMAIGAISRCLKRYGEETLITALQCVTQTTNNKPGTLSARMIKALCAVLAADPQLRDRGLALLELFDRIDLTTIAAQSAHESRKKRIDSVDALVDRIRDEIRSLTKPPSELAAYTNNTLPFVRRSMPSPPPETTLGTRSRKS